MQKHKKTAGELSDMILMKMGIAGIRVDVHQDSVYGWHVTVFGPPARVAQAQLEADRIAQDLRACCELSD
jgi:hypothetical protein